MYLYFLRTAIYMLFLVQSCCVGQVLIFKVLFQKYNTFIWREINISALYHDKTHSSFFWPHKLRPCRIALICILLKKIKVTRSREMKERWQIGSHWALDWHNRVLRCCEERYTACNTIQHNQCSSWSVMWSSPHSSPCVGQSPFAGAMSPDYFRNETLSGCEWLKCFSSQWCIIKALIW